MLACEAWLCWDVEGYEGNGTARILSRHIGGRARMDRKERDEG